MGLFYSLSMMQWSLLLGLVVIKDILGRINNFVWCGAIPVPVVSRFPFRYVSSYSRSPTGFALESSVSHDRDAVWHRRVLEFLCAWVSDICFNGGPSFFSIRILWTGHWRGRGLCLQCQIDNLNPQRKTKRVSNPECLLGGDFCVVAILSAQEDFRSVRARLKRLQRTQDTSSISTLGSTAS